MKRKRLQSYFFFKFFLFFINPCPSCVAIFRHPRANANFAHTRALTPRHLTALTHTRPPTVTTIFPKRNVLSPPIDIRPCASIAASERLPIPSWRPPLKRGERWKARHGTGEIDLEPRTVRPPPRASVLPYAPRRFRRTWKFLEKRSEKREGKEKRKKCSFDYNFVPTLSLFY